MTTPDRDAQTLRQAMRLAHQHNFDDLEMRLLGLIQKLRAGELAITERDRDLPVPLRACGPHRYMPSSASPWLQARGNEIIPG